MSSNSPLYAQAASPPLYHSGADLDAGAPVWHPALEYSQPLPMVNQSYNWTIKSEDSGPLESFHHHVPHSPIDIAQPAPTHHIDARYLESQSGSTSPEMAHSHAVYHHQQHVVPWPTPGAEYEYEYVSYPGAHAEVAPVPGCYYYGGGTYPVYSPYAHMQPSVCPPSYAQPHPTALYGYPINSPPTSRRSSYVPYTPISSNPSSGTTSPQFESLDPQYEYERINSTDGSETLLTPITPVIRPHPRMPTTLLLGQSGMTSEPIIMYSYPQQEAYPTFEPRPAYHEPQFQAPAPYLPLSPVSPVLEHPLAANKVPSNAPTPMVTAPSSATFVAESGQQDDDTLIPMENSVDEVAQSQAQAAERLKKLRERRHVVACTFCRGRKIACHSPAAPLPSIETDDGIPPGVAQSSPSSPHAHDDEYKPKAASSSARRAPPAPGVARSTCENCLRRGRECVYPPRVPRLPRRRRKAATAAPVAAEPQPPSPRYPVLSINTSFLN